MHHTDGYGQDAAGETRWNYQGRQVQRNGGSVSATLGDVVRIRGAPQRGGGDESGFKEGLLRG
jgi:hypothetical protein